MKPVTQYLNSYAAQIYQTLPNQVTLPYDLATGTRLQFLNEAGLALYNDLDRMAQKHQEMAFGRFLDHQYFKRSSGPSLPNPDLTFREGSNRDSFHELYNLSAIGSFDDFIEKRMRPTCFHSKLIVFFSDKWIYTEKEELYLLGV